MLVRVLKKEKVGGKRIDPGDISNVPDWMVPALEAQGSVERIEPSKLTNMLAGDALRNLPEGSFVLAKVGRRRQQ